MNSHFISSPTDYSNALTCMAVHIVLLNKKTSAVRSRISSKLIFWKLRGILRSRVLRVFMWPHQECYSLLRGTKSDSCGTYSAAYRCAFFFLLYTGKFPFLLSQPTWFLNRFWKRKTVRCQHTASCIIPLPIDVDWIESRQGTSLTQSKNGASYSVYC